MSPCSPNDVSFPSPTVPGGFPIPGVGHPFILDIPNLSPFPAGFPEDLLDLFNRFQLLIPPGALKPPLNPNFAKDIFDAIMSMLDQFFPFLMLYKFFLPVLNLIICIIEVLCALMNPFALTSAINRLFSQCIPDFLNLFPIFALIIMIISLILLLIAIIEYITSKILAFIEDIIRNIQALVNAFNGNDANGVLAVAKKLGALLCIFQNLFVILAIISVIIEIIKDILKLDFSIPPCENSPSGDTNGCCSTLTCPSIVQNQYENFTGTLQYYPSVGLTNTAFPGFSFPLRSESWQLYDTSQTISQAFSNIYDGYDIPNSVNPKPVFFPTDANYTASTSPNQAAYTIDLRLFYDPTNWGRTGTARYIRFTNCIMLYVPSPNLISYDNSQIGVPTGVVQLAGGLGYEDDGITKLTGFAADGVTPISDQATLNNFLHLPNVSVTGSTLPNDGYTFTNIDYTFKPNLQVLLAKQLVTLGCEPGVTLNRQFLSTVMFSNVGIQSAALQNLQFPDPNAALQCLTTALSGLRANLSMEGVATFQTTALTCLNNLNDDCNNALRQLISIGFNPCQSTFTLSPNVQFTSSPITVTVNLNENNGINLAQGIPATVGAQLASQIVPHITFGSINSFSYDGYSNFVAEITSDKPGTGSIMISFDNQIFCTDTISSDPTVPPTHTLQSKTYQFVYAPVAGTIPEVSIGEDGGFDQQPRRDVGDISRDNKDGG
jgi:hypothetical protein